MGYAFPSSSTISTCQYVRTIMVGSLILAVGVSAVISSAPRRSVVAVGPTTAARKGMRLAPGGSGKPCGFNVARRKTTSLRCRKVITKRPGERVARVFGFGGFAHGPCAMATGQVSLWTSSLPAARSLWLTDFPQTRHLRTTGKPVR